MITSNNFDEIVIKKKAIALIVFTADWCRPCLLQKQALIKLKENFAAKALIETVDVDAESELADRFSANNLPTSVLFANGETIEILPGYQAEEFLHSYLDHILAQQETIKSDSGLQS